MEIEVTKSAKQEIYGTTHEACDFSRVRFTLCLSEEDVQKSCEILKSKNVRVVYREIEYTPYEIFTSVTKYWNKRVDLDTVIRIFFKGIELKSIIYDDTVACLENLKEQGVKVAALTDLPTVMPDEIFKQDIIAARNAGCVSILINRKGKENNIKDYRQDFTITTLNELSTILCTE